MARFIFQWGFGILQEVWLLSEWDLSAEWALIGGRRHARTA
jgi:hypothetical protein